MHAHEHQLQQLILRPRLPWGLPPVRRMTQRTRRLRRLPTDWPRRLRSPATQPRRSVAALLQLLQLCCRRLRRPAAQTRRPVTQRPRPPPCGSSGAPGPRDAEVRWIHVAALLQLCCSSAGAPGATRDAEVRGVQRVRAAAAVSWRRRHRGGRHRGPADVRCARALLQLGCSSVAARGPQRVRVCVRAQQLLLIY